MDQKVQRAAHDRRITLRAAKKGTIVRQMGFLHQPM